MHSNDFIEVICRSKHLSRLAVATKTIVSNVTTQGIINADSLLTPMFALLAYPDADYPKAYPIESRSMLIVY